MSHHRSSQGTDTHLRTSSNVVVRLAGRESRQSPLNDSHGNKGDTNYVVDARSYDAFSKNGDAISIPDCGDPNDVETVKAENIFLREKIAQMERDQEMILQLNQMLLEKLAQVSYGESSHIPL